ncbi:MAG TPA: hypothetical protein VFQ88_06350, partial [Nevskiaceae bacterium]|nr:hypothetical protein [Nevskiaceae bacterium]
MKSLLILVRRKLTITALALAAVVMPFIASAAPGVVQTPALRIAVIDPMSGPLGVIGQDEMANLQFIGNSINRHGGVDGHVLKFTAFDNNFSAKETVTQFQKGLAQGIRYFVLETSAPMASALLHAIDLHNAHDPHDPALFLDNGA